MALASMKDNVQLFINKDTEAELTAEDKVVVKTIGEIGNGEAEEIEVTDLSSEEREYTQGYSDPGTLDITMNMAEGVYEKFDEYKQNNDILKFGLSILTRDKKTQVLGLAGKCYVQSAKITGMEVGGVLEVAVTFKLTGKITSEFVNPTVTGA